MAEDNKTSTTGRETVIDESMHALPKWFAAFQKTFGLTFLVMCSAYLMGRLATLGWVENIYNPKGWGWLDGAGVIMFFLGGIVISGIALTCSLAFARTLQMRPFRLGQFITMLFLLGGMVLFFGIEVWSSLAERSNHLTATPMDLAVLHAFGYYGTMPISPTSLIVSLMFPLGSLYFGFVQQGRVHKTDADYAAIEAEEEHKARMAEKRGKTQRNKLLSAAQTTREMFDVARGNTEEDKLPLA